MKTVDVKKENFTPVHVLAEDALLEGQPVLRVVKKDKIDIYDENTYAKVNGLQFHNGVIGDERAEFYLDQNPEPVLVVEDMKHGIGEKGAVGIFVDIGTEAFVSELKVTCTD